MLGINVFQRSLGLISTVVLARLLPPEDFGLVAMATVLMVFLQVLTEFGFDVALIQKQDATREHYDTAWTCNVLLGLISAALLASLAVPAASFYAEARVTELILVYALVLVARGFRNIGIVDFRKNLEFQREFIFYTSIKVISFVVTIVLAITTRNYWALALGSLTASVADLILSYVMHSYRPRITFSKVRELFSFSVWMFFNNLLLFVRTRGADLFVGRLLGARNLGLFTIGYEIASLPTTELIAPINRAIFPGYSKIANEPYRMQAAFLNVLSVIALVALPTAVGIALVSDLAIPLLLGEKWVGAVPLVELLALVGLLSSLHSNTGVAYIALGKPYIHVCLQSVAALLLFPLVFALTPEMGILGVAYAYLIANGTTFVANIFIASRLLKIAIWRLGAAIIRPLISAVLMYVAVTWLKEQSFATSLLLELVLAAAFGALVFVVAELAFWSAVGRPAGAEQFVLDKARALPVVGPIANRLLPNG